MATEDELKEIQQKEGYSVQVIQDAMMAEFAGEDYEAEEPKSGEDKDSDPPQSVSDEKERDEPPKIEEMDSDKEKVADEKEVIDSAPDPLDVLKSSLNARVRKTEGKLGEVNTRLKELTDAINKKGDDEKTAQKLKELDEVIERFRQEDPDANNAMAANATKAVEELRKEFDSRGFVSQELFQNELKKATFAIRQELTLDIAHKNWQDTIKTETFQSWLSSQDEATQALADSDYASDAITLLDQYKAQQQKSTERMAREQAEKDAEEKTAAEKADKRSKLEDGIPPTSGSEKPSKRTMTEFEAMMAEFNS